jgi:hypothetical protein
MSPNNERGRKTKRDRERVTERQTDSAQGRGKLQDGGPKTPMVRGTGNRQPMVVGGGTDQGQEGRENREEGRDKRLGEKKWGQF